MQDNFRTIKVAIPGREYPIHVGRACAGLVSESVRRLRAGKVAVITDSNVTRAHPTFARPLAEMFGGLMFEIAPGEASKSLEYARRIFDELAVQRIERTDVVVAFGGGVVGDLAGFIAGTWMRGIAWIQVPTTVEAAIDASVGGKTAVNHPSGKNLIGVFHQPSAVIVDTAFLDTLDTRDVRAGLAESVKHGVVRDPVFFEWQVANAARVLAREPEAMEELIARNVTIKAEIVTQDEREGGLRAILNYGHTIGHALEHEFEFELRHGECVALGMIVENELAVRRGILARDDAERVLRLVVAFELPRRLPRGVSAAEVCAAIRGDKKARGGAANFALAAGIGKTARVNDFSDAEIAAALGSIQPAGPRGAGVPPVGA